MYSNIYSYIYISYLFNYIPHRIVKPRAKFLLISVRKKCVFWRQQ